ncbi:aldose 1-epimerase [Segetibacter aerophilus]|uniref:Aldose epimerase n=1 Tax=Segetibacter aerophilus TaxID=670293 RepID=A0A512BCP0_9BACT|nr:aldose 1-epimerase [Segetibacter aerophilus]GEO09736.1 aldose epimerase [Segetibacter aerophilus]
MAFEVTVSSFGKHSVIILKDVTTNTFAEIYSFGALLNNFTSEHHGKVINVIDGFSSLAESTEKVTVFFKSAKLSPFACRVKNSKYKFGQNEYMLSKFALRGTAIHGLIYNAPFEITEQVQNDEKASVKLSFLYENEMEGYPFKFKTEVEYTLTEGNALTIKTTATNVDSQLLPMVDGWHPYFTLGDSINDYQVEFQSKEMLEFDEDLVPTGKLIPYQEFGSIKNFGPHELDNCFTLNFAECQPMCVIRHPQKKVQIEFHPEESYPYLQVYTPEHRKSIAVENLSGAPDAFNNGIGLKVLQPGESATFTTKFITRSL